ncbi:MAG: hypothetical protein A2511_11940 [Deltaproteobacteria bacterium RIFOXYD12_FULL_50_9]|nr:MAG: hypothetical protein A2511_11940 [Deltaproteobacteria bacterium RIFOXYD12_FULL_50_9]
MFSKPSLTVKLGVLGFIIFILPGLFVVWISSYAFTAGAPDDGVTRMIEIPFKTGLRGIQEILEKNGYIKNDIRFLLAARVMGVAKQLKAGEYALRYGLSPYQILLLLESGENVAKPVTIPEGLTAAQIADILAAGSWVDRKTFLNLTRDPDFIKELGIEAKSLEGYLFPDTYHLALGQSPQAIIRMMTNRFQTITAELSQRQEPGVRGLSPLGGLSLHEIITLASIVEKESAKPFERPMIAAVFLNRLKIGMPLQADPTVIYGLDSFNGNLTKHDLVTTTTYNTYTIKGLPPGPICNPGREAIQAVLQVTADEQTLKMARLTPYLYFVSKNDGTHYFSKTLAEHNKAVKQYQQAPALTRQRAKNSQKGE